ncbi:hypothetical protein [Streptomyces alboniger]|uniref:Uncharacterized protein n=1 Tax=Streptomyces alboniger TaxID=132473 RepID=A0A5J6HHW8_STRAD|nr:hypothetical protein [Streptomyces alboniger]QEV16675.1 hypothetical protein CP975_03395 [Streptomyces alboniger]
MNASDITTVLRRPTTAWPLENALVSAAMAAQRISWIDAPARALGLKVFTRRYLTRQVLAQLRRTARGRPILLRTAFGTFLTPLNAEDARSLIGAAEEAGARGAVTGLTSHGRRLRLSAHTPLPVALASLSARVRTVAAEEALEILAVRGANSALDRADWCAVTRRLARRVVLGDVAGDDTLVNDILEATLHAADTTEYAARVAALLRRLGPYVHDPAPDSVAAAVPDDGSRDGVVEHVLETVTRALTDTVPQALALASVRPTAPAIDRGEQAVGAALRHYPPLSATVHEVRAPFRWRGTGVDAGTEILYATAWLRDLDPARGHGDDAPSASLCAAPEPCAAAELAVLAACELTRALLRHAEPVVLSPQVERDALPADLHADSLDLALTDVHPHMTMADGTFTPGAGAAAPVGGRGSARHAALASDSARRLEEHARQLADCARQPGWNQDAFGEKCRMTLLAHAERCARAAADVSRAAQWFAR